MTGQRKVREIGIPVRAVMNGSLYAGVDEDGKDCIYAMMQQEATANIFVLQIDIESGDSKRFDAPDGIGSGPILWSDHWKRFFFFVSDGMHGNAHLYQLNPCAQRFEDLGTLVPEGPCLAISMNEAPDGTIYLGTYQNGCSLFSYSPNTGEFSNHGVADADEFYLYVSCGTDGTVAGLTKMSRPHVVALDTEAGTLVPVGPMANTDTQEGNVLLTTGGDGLLYIDSHEGAFRIEGTEIAPVDAIPETEPSPPTLSDGSTFKFLDARDNNVWLTRNRTVGIDRPDGSRKVIELDYEADGTSIYVMTEASDGKIYGSSILPLHFFSYDPKVDEISYHGACCTASGEVYSMGNLNGKLYLASYTHAILSEFDLAKPFSWGGSIPGKPGEFKMGKATDRECGYMYDESDNPRQIGRLGKVSYRPRDMVTGPAGKVWVASIPDYGMWGGTLTSYDPSTGSFGTEHRHIIENCSPISITHLKESDLLAIGLSMYGGSGTVPRALKGGFALWDPNKDESVWTGDLGLDLVGVMDIEDAGDGLCYAITHANPETALNAELMFLDLPNEKIMSRIPISEMLGWPLEVSFRRDDKYLYGAAREGIYRVPLGTTDLEILWQDKEDGPGPFIGACGLIDGVYYFGSGARLRCVDVE